MNNNELRFINEKLLRFLPVFRTEGYRYIVLEILENLSRYLRKLSVCVNFYLYLVLQIFYTYLWIINDLCLDLNQRKCSAQWNTKFVYNERVHLNSNTKCFRCPYIHLVGFKDVPLETRGILHNSILCLRSRHAF